MIQMPARVAVQRGHERTQFKIQVMNYVCTHISVPTPRALESIFERAADNKKRRVTVAQVLKIFSLLWLDHRHDPELYKPYPGQWLWFPAQSSFSQFLNPSLVT